MNEKTKHRVYEPPQARDLSAFGATGVGPLGVCGAGNYPYYNCLTGPDYFATCGGGGTVDTSFCNIGGYHADPQCSAGSVAATICKVGSHQ